MARFGRGFVKTVVFRRRPVTTFITTPITLAATMTLTPVISRQLIKPSSLAAGLTFTPTIIRKEFVAVNALLSATPALNRRVNVSLPASLTLTTALVRKLFKTISASLVLTPVLNRTLIRTLAASLVCSAAIQWSGFRVISTGLTLTTTLNRRLNRPVAASLSLTPLLSRKLFRPLSANLVLTPVMTFQATHLYFISLPASMASTVSLTLLPKRPRALSASLSLSPAVTRLVTRKMALAASMGLTANLTRQQKQQLAALLMLATDIQQKRFRTLNSNLVLQPAITGPGQARLYLISLAVALIITPNLTFRPGVMKFRNWIMRVGLPQPRIMGVDLSDPKIVDLQVPHKPTIRRVR